MATQLYKYYQLVGADEDWTPIQADQPLDSIRPTFVTALAVDTLFAKDTPKEAALRAKYQGPMYFDLDAEDIADAIAGAKDLWSKLKSYDLTADDVQIYLSGKKGLHFIVPERCFVEKPQPTMGLVAIYKEMAFALAVDTLDFRVYTAKRGRQFRTCYNQRENGNYKVPITAQELDDLTAESYTKLCKAPRTLPAVNPQWRGKFALLYDQAFQKTSKLKPKVLKPVPKSVLQQQLPIFKKLASGELQTEGGFNVIAMQLCLYAREMGWAEDQLVSSCAGLINNHHSDGIRYNSPRKRERELRRMFWYLEDNPSFEYSVQGIKACLAPEVSKNPAETQDFSGNPEEGDFVEVEESDFGGVYRGVTAYMASKGEDGDVAITNFLFKNVWLLRSLEFGTILTIKADVFVKGRKVDEANLSPNIFTGGTSLQNAIAAFGGSFSGTDIHARGVYQAMLREVMKDVYVLDSEGINVFSLGKDKGSEFVVWADRNGVRATPALAESGADVTFQGFPDTRGVYRTDLLSAPTLEELKATDPELSSLVTCMGSLIRSHSAEVMGKMLGWTVACYFAPLFQKVYGRFPMLHVYGPSGNGKTDTTRGLMRFFYHKADAVETTPASSPFALQQLAAGSASIPLLFDEWKPHTMNSDKLNQFRALLRDLYNAKEIQRGGGSKVVKDNFNALSTLKLQAPVVFVAEAPETETAIVERAVMVSFRRLSGRAQVEAYKSALNFYENTEPLASIGLEIASKIVATNDSRATLAQFEKSLKWANETFLPASDDWEKVENGEMTQERMRSRAIMRPRPVFNSTVSFFGLQVLKLVLTEHLGAEVFKAEFEERFKEMGRGCFLGMDTLALATLPEFVKVLSVFADMTKLPQGDMNALIEDVDYNLSEMGGKPVLVLACVQAYRKYRSYMRQTGSSPLYPSEESFQLAMQEIPQFIKQSNGTKRLDARTVVMDLEELYRASVPSWKGKAADVGL